MKLYYFYLMSSMMIFMSSLLSAATLGRWEPSLLKEGRHTLEWRLPKEEVKAGETYELIFRYESGANALQVHGVQVLSDGKEIHRELREGIAGGEPREVFYRFKAPNAGNLLTLRASVSGMGGNDSSGMVTLNRIEPQQVMPDAFSAAPFVVARNYLDRHDIVYQSPMQLEAEGFPLGNGDMGGLIWTHPQGIELQINKNDVWSSAEKGNPAPGSLCVPRHCARVKIDLGLPVFNWIHHLNDFEGRLSLAQGEAKFHSKTGFSNTQIRSWLPQDRNVWVIECDTQWQTPEEANLAKVSIERIGSRAFGGWYAGGIVPDPASGLANTQSRLVGHDMLIHETGDQMNFVVACRILDSEHKPVRLNRHRLEGFTHHSKFTVLVSVATKDESPDLEKAAIALLDGAQHLGMAKLRSEKDAWFRHFWSKSFVKLGDDYLENLYYLRRYLMGIGSRGKYPVIFNGGLWRWNRDVVNWITPHHWNTQQSYWGLAVQNDCDLMLSYLNTYDRIREHPQLSQLAARRGAPKDAIFISEMHQFDGFQVTPDRGDMVHSFTAAALIALRFWEYCEYSGDREFLKDKAYPFMKKAANFYLQKLTFDQASQHYTMRGTIYEDGNGAGPVTNPESDRCAIQALFKACISASKILKQDMDLVSEWQHRVDHLWEARLTQEKGIEGEVIATGIPAEKFSVKSWAIGGAAAFPYSLVGIDQKGTPIGQGILNYLKSLNSYMYSHHPTPIIAARLGAGDEALKLLHDGIGEMQYFPQGLMFNCRGYPSQLYQLDLQVNLLGGAKTTDIKWRDFFQCGMETMSICSTAMNEMMLQSNEGKIRVFPAIPQAWESSRLAFKLLAKGGFLVAAERDKGVTRQVSILSQLGGVCRIQSPWASESARLVEAKTRQSVPFRRDQAGVIAFQTVKGQEYIIMPSSQVTPGAVTHYTSQPNQEPKKLGARRTLGLGKSLRP